MSCAMAVRAKDIKRMHAQPPTPTSKAEAKDGEGKMAAKAITKADGAAKDLAERERAKGTKDDCMSSI